MNSIRKKAKRLLCLSALALLLAAPAGAWGQTWADGLYYLKSTDGNWYLWPSVVTNSESGNRYVTTYNGKSATAVAGIWDALDTTWSMWVVQNVTVEENHYIQLISPKLNAYVVIYDKTAVTTTYSSKPAYGDRDVWLSTTLPTDVTRTYFWVNTNQQTTSDGLTYYRISPTQGYNEQNTSDYANRSFNSATGNKSGLGSGANGTDLSDQRGGLIQLYNGDPKWAAVSTLMAAPTISDVNAYSTVTISDANSLPAGYTIRYTTDGNDPTATTGTVYNGSVNVTSSCTIKAVVVRYGIVLTKVASKAVKPVVALPVISFDNTTNRATISCATDGVTIYYTTDGSNPTTSSSEYTASLSVTTPTTVKAIAVKGEVQTEAATLAITQVAMPTVQNNGSNAVSITSATAGATIYYTTDGSNPTTSSTEYTAPLTENVSGVTIKAIAVKAGMINSTVGSGTVTLQCETPVIRRLSNTSFTATCSFPSSGVTIYYTTNGSDPTTSSSSFTSGSTVSIVLPATVKAMAVASGYNNSAVASASLTEGMGGDGSAGNPYTIEYQSDIADFVSKANTAAEASKYYKVISTEPLDFSSAAAITQPFSGTFDGNFQTLTGLTHALFNTVDSGTVRNVMLKSVSISTSGNVGALCNTAEGTARIYNCGILPTDPNFTTTSSIGSTTTTGSDGYCGSLVGLLDGTARVINCFSFANITGGNIVGGIVGNNNTSDATQSNYTTKTIVMNCFFYGDIDTTHVGGTPKAAYPVYGGNVIANDGTTSINNYNYYRDLATFDNSYGAISRYNRSWPAEERNIRRFEYYRSILNSNRRLCAFWITDHAYANQTADDTALVAKWVLDRSVAPYPVLKKWGKYPSIINPDPARVWDTVNNAWVQRSAALPYQGKSHGTLSVTVKPGSHNSTASDVKQSLVITEMDTLNYDYGYYKVQLPYYNELFGDPSSNVHATRYGNNYTDKVVTGWKIISVNSNDQGAGYTFDDDWEAGCNFADRTDKYKDLYAKSGRVFAQGGYYYVPEGVTAITIEAYWGDALYLHGKDHAVDRVNVTNNAYYGDAFAPAGTLPTTWDYNSMTIYDDLASVVGALSNASTVYDQAIVLVGQLQVQARSSISLDGTTKRVTFMSADLDMDNEPDFCWQLQWRNAYERLPILPVRFDFLPIPELGLAIRHNTYAYAIGIFVPKGHFEITETSFMHTTQFEYMSTSVIAEQHPLILNGGQFEQIVSHGNKNSPTTQNSTQNIIMGGHVWMKRFTPGSHSGQYSIARHCAVSIMGGDYPEFYLTGLYWTGADTNTAYADNPHCYTNGGRFGIMAGAGMEAVRGSVYFEIDHSVIDEFYGGGTNANNPVTRSINVTINNSLVLDKYCGGPKVGTSQTVTTNATGTIFNQYYGGGNGGTNLYRENIKDETPGDMPNESTWGSTYGWNGFTPISTQGTSVTYDANKGYHAEFEFEVFNQSNGINNSAVARSYRHWAQFGTTETGNVANTLKHCTVNNNFYAGGNLGNVSGTVTSTLDSCTVNGSAFGGGYSASIPHFPVHDKSKVTFPYRDAAGVCHNGTVGYRTDEAPNDTVIQYTWCYKNPTTNEVSPAGVEIPAGVSTSKPAFQYDGKWYCYTTVSLEGLGTVSSNATLTLKGDTEVTGSVYGGGDESAVDGNATVLLQGGTHVGGNVLGGGNRGAVGGNSSVTIQDP